MKPKPKPNRVLILVLLAGLLAIASICVSCTALKTELGLGNPSTNAPPIATQLQTAAPLAEAAIPSPWGSIVSSSLMSLAAIASAVAAWHAKNSAALSASANPAAAANKATT
jgi:hypothetical protein